MKVWVWKDDSIYVSPTKPKRGLCSCGQSDCKVDRRIESPDAIGLCRPYGLFKGLTKEPKKFELTAKEIR